MDASRFIDHMADIGKADIGIEEKIMTWLQLLAGVRQSMLGQEMIRRYGRVVQGGPFKGMKLTLENPSTFHLMGFYETPLLPHLEELASRPYDHIINLGSSFGYYAVGMALRIPEADVVIYEIDDNIRQMCREMAALNNVEDRFDFRGAAEGSELEAFQDGRSLIICDIEGAEKTILDPQRYPALTGMDILVELHDCIDDSISAELTRRFEKTHDIIIAENDRMTIEYPPLFKELASIDQVIAAWDGRSGPTPWGIFTAR
ncbi:hypothetical protein [Aestuariispira insulae]|uniref:FkbM family methyltransferase n=1 Tax=Aestuariispira insulae TaxID=1461337 RepID=A0A3D9HS25_9PROT|nr:hypothetical protein [Aestuariispira insulae]RED52297.1 hypothetical protein DFP90_102317 [Aestuariispira insulae]